MDARDARPRAGRNEAVATSLLVLGILSLAIAYSVIEGLLGPYRGNVTVVDLGTVLILGLIAGGALALAAIFWRGRRAPP